MGRFNYSFVDQVNQATRKPINRYKQLDYDTEFILKKIENNDTSVNVRDLVQVENTLKFIYNISKNVLSDPIKYKKEIKEVKVRFNGSRSLFVYGDSQFEDPGVEITNGKLVSVLTNFSREENGDIKRGTQYVYYLIENDLGYSRYYIREVYFLDAPKITIKGPNPYFIELGYADYKEYGAYSDGGQDVLIDSTKVNTTRAGTYDVTYTATDGKGNTKIKIRRVIVRDTLSPVLNIIGNKTIYVEKGGVYSEPGVEVDGEYSISTDKSSLNLQKVGEYKIRYTSVDEYGNVGLANRTVVVRDTTPPVITLNGSKTIYLEAGQDTYTELGATADGGEPVSITVTDISTGKIVDSVDTNAVKIYTVTYSAQDGYGNRGITLRTVVVQDKTPPQVSFVGDEYIYLEKGVDTFVDESVSVTGGRLDSTVIKTANDETVDTIDTSEVGVFRVVYRSIDDYNNVTTRTRVVTVRDTTGPNINVTGDLTVVLELGDTYTELGATTEEPGLTVTYTDNIDESTVGSYTVTYEATDSFGNVGKAYRIVLVEDNTPPVITINGSENVILQRGVDAYTESGATSDGGETVTTVIRDSGNNIVGSINTNTVGSYKISYSATDSEGNSATVFRNVSIIDTKNPVITLNGSNRVVLERSLNSYTESGATSDGGETVTITIRDSNDNVVNSIDNTINGEYIVTYSSEDEVGNIGYAYRRVTVRDTTGPIITLNGYQTIEIPLGGVYNEEGATSDGGETVTIAGTVNTNTLGNYNITYSSTDTYGNSTSETRTIKIIDITPPVVSLVGNATVKVTVGTAYSEQGAVSDGGENVIISGNVDVDTIGDYVITYSATDASGNIGTNRRTVQVVDDIPPDMFLNQPDYDNITISQNSVFVDPGAYNNENLEVITFVTKNGDSLIYSEIDTSVPGVYCINYCSEDSYGNKGVITRNVTVVDDIAPSMSLVGNSTIEIPVGDAYSDQGVASSEFSGNTLTTVITDSNGDAVDSINTDSIDSFKITYTLSDAAGNSTIITRDVHVVDVTPPTLELVDGSQTVEVEKQAGYYTDPGAIVVGEDLNVTSVILDENNQIVSSINAATVGRYTIKYYATDPSGNEGTIFRTIIVKDTTPPDIILVGESEINIEYIGGSSTIYSDPGASSTETGVSISKVIKNTSTNQIVTDIKYNAVANYEITYYASDSYGNTSEIVRNVYVKDTTPPVITTPLGNPLYMTAGMSFPENAVAVTGGTITNRDLNGLNTNVAGAYTVKYTASDDYNNISTLNLTVYVQAPLNTGDGRVIAPFLRAD